VSTVLENLQGFDNLGDLTESDPDNQVSFSGSLFPVVAGETWEDHFINNSWTTIEDQLLAGWGCYLQPFASEASFSQVFDLGTEVGVGRVLAEVDYTDLAVPRFVDPPLSVMPGFDQALVIETSLLSTGPWVPLEFGNNSYASGFRYVRVSATLTEVATLPPGFPAGYALGQFSQVAVQVSVQEKSEAGRARLLLSDDEGTFVALTQDFSLLYQVSAQPVSVSAPQVVVVLHDFTDFLSDDDGSWSDRRFFDWQAGQTLPIEGFYAKSFDLSGTRTTTTVTWSVTGV